MAKKKEGMVVGQMCVSVLPNCNLSRLLAEGGDSNVAGGSCTAAAAAVYNEL